MADAAVFSPRLPASPLAMASAARPRVGQRHIITRDPNGVLLDVIEPIPPSDEFMKQYAAGTAPAHGRVLRSS